VSSRRLAVAVLLVAATAALSAAAGHRPRSTGPVALAVPYTIGAWRGTDAAPLDAATARALAADVTLNRTYTSRTMGPVGFYLAYYAAQRPGVSIHSPLHCLPGTGWDILSDQTMRVTVGSGVAGPVRRLVARKGDTEVLILYWYLIRGRMIASDLASRVQLLGDRLRLGRNDGAFVRLVVPIQASEGEAEARGVAFARTLVPRLPEGL
jgi:EpsI family protein